MTVRSPFVSAPARSGASPRRSIATLAAFLFSAFLASTAASQGLPQAGVPGATALPRQSSPSMGGSLLFSAPGEDPPFNSSGSWHFRRGAADIPCQLWFPSGDGTDVVLRVRPNGASASLLVASPERAVLPQRGATAELSWSAGETSARSSVWGVADGTIAVAEVGRGSLTSAAAIQLVGKPSLMSVSGIALRMPPVHPMIWMTFGECLASPSSLPEGTTARWRPSGG